MADARFLLRPRWLLSHVLVVLLIVVMVNLGFWQLRRLDFKRDRNALIEARMDQPVVAVDDLLGPDADAAAIDAARYRRVSATGTYDDSTLVVRNRSQDGAPGGWLVTPMTVAPGTTVGVVRGFVGFDPDGNLVAAPAPHGPVTVEGLVIDPGRIDGTAHRDLAPFLAGDGVVPALVLAAHSTPPEPAAPTDAREPTIGPIVPVPPPELSEGPHLGYAVQWFIFSTIAIVGYPIVLRRVVARRGKEVDDDGPDPERCTPWPATRT